MLIPDQGGLVTGTKLTNKYVKQASFNLLVIKSGRRLILICNANLVQVICGIVFYRTRTGDNRRLLF
jgi:hypothetical protein